MPRVRARLREDLRVAVAIAHTDGCRCRSELLTPERRHASWPAASIQLATTCIVAESAFGDNRRL
jgi:hypothetical protein